jgi:hypothetical protein
MGWIYNPAMSATLGVGENHFYKLILQLKGVLPTTEVENE